MASSKNLVFDLSRYQSAFMHSEAQVVFFVGPMGEGKTFAAIAGLLTHAKRNGRKTLGAIVRDTRENIKCHTIPDMIETLGDRVTFHDDNRKCIIHAPIPLELQLFRANDPADLFRFQGLNGFIVAPIEDNGNARGYEGSPSLQIYWAARKAYEPTDPGKSRAETCNP